MTRTRLTPEQRRERARLRAERWRRAHGIGPRKPAQRSERKPMTRVTTFTAIALLWFNQGALATPPSTGSKPELYEIQCRDLNSAMGTSKFSDVMDPISAALNNSAGDFGSDTNRRDYILTFCRENKTYTALDVIAALTDMAKSNTLPPTPLGEATADPKIHKQWNEFDKWIKPQLSTGITST